MPHKITLMGKRGRYSLVRNYAVIATGTNRERLRGIQFFLEAKPEYAAAPELLEACKIALYRLDPNNFIKPSQSDEQIAAELLAAIAKAKVGDHE